MKTSSTLKFDAEYMRKRKHIAWRGPIIAEAIAKHFGLGMIADVGGGIGDIAAGLAELGAKVWVIDSSKAAVEATVYDSSKYHICDMTTSIWLNLMRPVPFDLVLCFEVLSVIPKGLHSNAIRFLSSCGNRILCNHIEAIPGYTLNEEKTQAFREELKPWGHKPAVKAIYRTASFFERDK